MFKRLGIRSVSMDDLAKHLGMSKKTIYQHFDDKRALVNEVFKADMEMDKRVCIETCTQNHNAVEQFVNISAFINHSLKDTNPAVLHDLQKYYPECWSEFDAFTKDFIRNYIIENLKTGIEQGYYRESIVPSIIADIYIGLIHQVVHPSNARTAGPTLAEVHQQIIRYHLHGISTQKGIKHLTQIINNE